MAWIKGIGGAVLVLLVIEDVFFTVVAPGDNRAALRVPLTRGIWRLLWFTGRLPAGRRYLLPLSGPLLLVATVAAWVCLLAGGFALIVWPAVGSAVRASSGPTAGGFVTALYVSAYSLTTLGTGDVVATTGAYRMLMVAEAAVGFGTISMALTYFLSVYSALVRRNTLALSLQHRSADTGDAAELLARLGSGGDIGGAKQDIGTIAESLLNVLASHRAYPILLYYHYREPYFALPRLLFVSLELATLARSGLNSENHRALHGSAALTELWEGSLHLLHECCRLLQVAMGSDDDAPHEGWRERYHRATGRLRSAGIAISADRDAGASRYVELRRQWNGPLTALARRLAYEWNAIAPDDDTPG